MAASRAIMKMKALAGNFCTQIYLAQSISEITRAVVFLPNNCLHMEYLPSFFFCLEENLFWKRLSNVNLRTLFKVAWKLYHPNILHILNLF